MNTFKAEVNKIILGLTLVGLVLLMLPVSLSAGHFRYGTMFWETIGDNGTIRLYMKNGWTANHSWIPKTVGDRGAQACNWTSCSEFNITIIWGDGNSEVVDFKVTSIDTNDTNSEIGDNSSGWESGLTHDYPDNATTEYIVYWGSSSRASTENMGGSQPWRNATKVNIGGAYANNDSPVSAVPPVVKVQDNQTFLYQVIATDANGDNLTYRWGTYAEFFSTTAAGTFTEPTGMTLSNSGLISWDVRDSVLCSGCSQDDVNNVDDLWVAVIMVEDNESGNVKSYIPLDFFFKITDPANYPPEFTQFSTGTQTVSVGTTKTFTIKSTDDSGDAPTVTVLNPPSDNTSIWDNTTSTSGGETTYSINFTPDSSMGNKSYAVNIRSTDGAAMTKDKSLGLYVSTVSNADPTAPILLSPADNSTVTQPVTFQWKLSTDSDNDVVSYNIYICTDSGFDGCSGTSVTADVNFNPPFNQNFHDSLIPWPRPLHAATISQQISQDPSMIPKWVIMLGVLGLLSGFISLSVKNITHRRIVFMFIFLTFCFSLTIISCSEKDEYGESWEKKGATKILSASDTDTTTTTDITYSTSDLTTNTTYYWKVIASDTKGGSTESETWSFTVN